MSQCRYLVAAVVMVACVSTLSFRANPVHANQQSGDEQLIREARARSNAAIAAHDPAAMARLWKDDVHVVRSTGARVAGREANRERMAQQFAARPDTIYVRQPLAVDVYCSGRWRQSVGSGPPDGLSRTERLTRPERTWRSGIGSKERRRSRPSLRAYALFWEKLLQQATVGAGRRTARVISAHWTQEERNWYTRQ